MTTDETPEGPRPPWCAQSDDDKIGGIDDAPPEPPVYPEPNGLCPVCALEGKRVPLNKRGVCPFQAAERKMISLMRRESIRKAVAQRDTGIPF